MVLVPMSEAVFTLTQEDIDECTVTLEQVDAEMVTLEAQLAVKFSIQGDVRTELIRMYNDPLGGQLDDGHIGMDWVFAYETFVEMQRRGLS